MLLYQIIVIFCFLPSLAFCDIKTNPNRVVKVGESTSVWCASPDSFTECQWTFGGKRCVFKRNTEKCDEIPDIFPDPEYFSTGGNCSILISSVTHAHQGPWKCFLKGFQNEQLFSKEIRITVVNPRKNRAVQDPTVKIYLDGSKLTYPLGETIPVKCNAKCGPGERSFQWEIQYVEKKTELTNYSSETCESRNRESITSELTYKAKMEHDGKKLRCVFIERDGFGEIEYEKTDEVDLEITYIKNLKIQGNLTARAGEDLDVIVQFEAKPKPALEDMIWTINKKDGTSTNVILTNSGNREQDYESFPLIDIGNQNFEAKLTFYDIKEDVGNVTHTFTIQHKGDLSKKHVKPKVIQFTIDVMAGKRWETSTIIGIVVVVVLIVPIGIGIFLVRKCQKPNKSKKASEGSGTHEEEKSLTTK